MGITSERKEDGSIGKGVSKSKEATPLNQTHTQQHKDPLPAQVSKKLKGINLKIVIPILVVGVISIIVIAANFIVHPTYEPDETPNSLNNKGIALADLGKYNEAITYYDKALAINPNYLIAIFNKGNALDDLGKYDEAITYYDKALAINPNDLDVLYNKGNALDDLGKYDEAITYYDKALAIDPNDNETREHRDLALKLKGST